MKNQIVLGLLLSLVIMFFSGDVLAKNKVNMHADISDAFTINYKDLPDEIKFRTTKDETIKGVVSIPQNSLITMEVVRAQRQLRWHKSGLILCKLKNYIPEGTDSIVDVSDKEIYVAIRKYEKINKKEAFIIGTELVLAQGASFFAPGVDIGYFFIKGAIQKKKDPNWFKAGVHNAYDNSIFWFCQKGKSIELTEGDQVKIKDIKPKKVEKMISKIDRRTERFERQALHRIEKKEQKALKREYKHDKKMVDCTVVENTLEGITVDRSVLAEIIKSNSTDKN